MSYSDNKVFEDQRHRQVELGERMGRLLDNEDFKQVFQEVYLNAFAITNLNYLHQYDDATRRRFLEKSLARSIFVDFIDTIVEEGLNAKQSLQEDVE